MHGMRKKFVWIRWLIQRTIFLNVQLHDPTISISWIYINSYYFLLIDCIFLRLNEQTKRRTNQFSASSFDTRFLIWITWRFLLFVLSWNKMMSDIWYFCIHQGSRVHCTKHKSFSFWFVDKIFQKEISIKMHARLRFSRISITYWDALRYILAIRRWWRRQRRATSPGPQNGPLRKQDKMKYQQINLFKLKCIQATQFIDVNIVVVVVNDDDDDERP